MQVAPLKTSETWLLLINVVLQALVHAGVIPDATSAAINAVAIASLPVLFQTIFRKVRAGTVPFVQPTAK